MSVIHTLAKTFGITQTTDGSGLDGWFFRRWFSFIAMIGPLHLMFLEYVTNKDTQLNRDIVAACRDVIIWVAAIYLLGSSAQYILSARFGGALQKTQTTVTTTRQTPYLEPVPVAYTPGEHSQDISIDNPDARRRH